MLNIKPVSELRNYNKILTEVNPDAPLFLTKNGYGKYTILDIKDYERLRDSLTILNKLRQAQKGHTHSMAEVRQELLGK
ncbi:type II toxin-antitoxin system Phd/YefM family antitoxin [Lactiplantibacillus dongliensis]|uniref:Type II toxin-antitoxin system Phd/YefM family antitoxin n=1 Tax=Lactiplantibacillus dongliensis TaxID=2559919 RepID=A0ABW1R782_9LACO|nr:type II toxin-antitoxin system Phd/YefM family antitoxin [Lactiplantibacillus dongliensis]